MNEGLNASDIALLSNGNGFGGNNFMWIFALLILANGGFGGWNRGGYFYGNDAANQEILFNQHFNSLDNKIDRGFTSIGNGLSDLGFALNNSIKDGNAAVAGRVVDEGRALQNHLTQGFADTNATTIAQTQKILDAIAQNKIDSLQAQVSELKTQNMFCGIPRINPYGYGVYPYQGCGCGGYAN